MQWNGESHEWSNWSGRVRQTMQQPSSPRQCRPTMLLTTGGHNPTPTCACARCADGRLPHHLCVVPGSSRANRNGPVAVTGLDYCTKYNLFPEHSSMTVTRRPKIQNEIRKKLNFGKRSAILPKNEFNIPTFCDHPTQVLSLE